VTEMMPNEKRNSPFTSLNKILTHVYKSCGARLMFIGWFYWRIHSERLIGGCGQRWLVNDSLDLGSVTFGLVVWPVCKKRESGTANRWRKKTDKKNSSQNTQVKLN